MEKIDDLTRAKLREWQMRRLEIKDQIQSQPEKLLELSRVLDLMDDEHAEILAEAARMPSKDQADLKHSSERPATVGSVAVPLEGRFSVQLSAEASSADDLYKLLEIATYELRKQLDLTQIDGACAARRYLAGMSGTLGGYNFELDVGS